MKEALRLRERLVRAWLFTIHGLSSKKMASQKEQVLHVTVPCWDLATRKPVGGQASRLMLRTQVKPAQVEGEVTGKLRYALVSCHTVNHAPSNQGEAQWHYGW